MLSSDTSVDFDHSLSMAMMNLLDALGDSSDAPFYIETIPRGSYPVSPSMRNSRWSQSGFSGSERARDRNPALLRISLGVLSRSGLSALDGNSSALPTPVGRHSRATLNAQTAWKVDTPAPLLKNQLRLHWFGLIAQSLS